MRSPIKISSENKQRISVLIIVVCFITACTNIKGPPPDVAQTKETMSPLATQNPHITEIWVIPEKDTPAPTPTVSPLDMIPTDPELFSLASGKIQFVEFFRFG